MPLQFEIGEEKLAEAFKNIDLLWKCMLVLKTRNEIDSLVINSLICANDWLDAGEAWRRMSSEWLSTEWPRSLNAVCKEQMIDEMKSRVRFWNDVFTNQVNLDE